MENSQSHDLETIKCGNEVAATCSADEYPVGALDGDVRMGMVDDSEEGI